MILVLLSVSLTVSLEYNMNQYVISISINGLDVDVIVDAFGYMEALDRALMFAVASHCPFSYFDAR